MLKGYMVREKLGTPDLTLALYCTMTKHICVIVSFEYPYDMDHKSDSKININTFGMVVLCNYSAVPTWFWTVFVQ